MGEQTHYEVLGIDEHATSDQIRDAWKTLIQVWHPDRFKGEMRARAEEMTKTVNAAYSCLRDPSTRWLYDQELRVSRRHGASDSDLHTETAEEQRKLPGARRSICHKRIAPALLVTPCSSLLSLVLARVTAYCGLAIFVDDINGLPTFVNFIGVVIAATAIEAIWRGLGSVLVPDVLEALVFACVLGSVLRPLTFLWL